MGITLANFISLGTVPYSSDKLIMWAREDTIYGADSLISLVDISSNPELFLGFNFNIISFTSNSVTGSKNIELVRGAGR